MNEDAIRLGVEAVRQIVRRVKFYQWAYGYIGEADAEIGILGEYVVGSALGCLSRKRTVKGEYDLITKDGTTIEVKTSCRQDPASKGHAKERWRWQIKDQKRALEGKTKIADWWIFIKVELPPNAVQRRLFNPFDDRWYTVYLITGEALLKSGVKSHVGEATLARCNAITCKPSELKAILSRCASAPACACLG